MTTTVAALGSEIRVNTATASFQDSPQITALSNGGFVVTWQDFSLGVGGATRGERAAPDFASAQSGLRLLHKPRS